MRNGLGQYSVIMSLRLGRDMQDYLEYWTGFDLDSILATALDHISFVLFVISMVKQRRYEGWGMDIPHSNLCMSHK